MQKLQPDYDTSGRATYKPSIGPDCRIHSRRAPEQQIRFICIETSEFHANGKVARLAGGD